MVAHLRPGHPHDNFVVYQYNQLGVYHCGKMWVDQLMTIGSFNFLILGSYNITSKQVMRNNIF